MNLKAAKIQATVQKHLKIKDSKVKTPVKVSKVKTPVKDDLYKAIPIKYEDWQLPEVGETLTLTSDFLGKDWLLKIEPNETDESGVDPWVISWRVRATSEGEDYTFDYNPEESEQDLEEVFQSEVSH